MCKNSLFPNEIYENILKYTTIDDLYNFIWVSKNWKQICSQLIFFKKYNIIFEKSIYFNKKRINVYSSNEKYNNSFTGLLKIKIKYDGKNNNIIIINCSCNYYNYLFVFNTPVVKINKDIEMPGINYDDILFIKKLEIYLKNFCIFKKMGLNEKKDNIIHNIWSLIYNLNN